ncbi:MAG: hypothetical protein ACK5JM_00915 [Rhodoblastus sp.]
MTTAGGFSNGPGPDEPPGNPIARMIVTHWILGSALGIACAGILLAINPLELRTLLMRSDAMIAGLAMLFIGFGTTFGALVSATAVMMQKKDDDDDRKPPSGGMRAPVLAHQLVPERVRHANSFRPTGVRRY